MSGSGAASERWLADPACPRCGYALGGVVSSWRESCPLEGVCSECGLGLRWREVLDAELAAPSWSFEHAEHGVARAFLRTIARAPFPGVPWGAGGLTMLHPVVPARLATLVVAGIPAMHLPFALVIATVCLVDPLAFEDARSMSWAFTAGGGAQLVPTPGDALLTGLWPYGRVWGDMNPLPLYCGLVAVLMPLAFVCLPRTLARARVRRAHLVRLGCYGAWIVPVVPAVVMLGLELPESGARLLGGAGRVPSLLGRGVELVLLLAGMLALTAAPVWVAAWWARAVRVYLALPRAWLVAVLLLVVAMLGAMVVLVYGLG